MSREIMTYELFGSASRELATQIAASGFEPDILLGIARGGLIPAGALAYALDCKNLFTISVEFYTGVDERLEVPVVLPPFLDAHDLDDARVLIIDDVADTGKTLELVHNFCAGHVREARTAVLYQKPRSIIQASYAWRHTDQWINFPWSSEPPVTGSKGTEALDDDLDEDATPAAGLHGAGPQGAGSPEAGMHDTAQLVGGRE